MIKGLKPHFPQMIHTFSPKRTWSVTCSPGKTQLPTSAYIKMSNIDVEILRSVLFTNTSTTATSASQVTVPGPFSGHLLKSSASSDGQPGASRSSERFMVSKDKVKGPASRPSLVAQTDQTWSNHIGAVDSADPVDIVESLRIKHLSLGGLGCDRLDPCREEKKRLGFVTGMPFAFFTYFGCGGCRGP